MSASMLHLEPTTQHPEHRAWYHGSATCYITTSIIGLQGARTLFGPGVVQFGVKSSSTSADFLGSGGHSK
jgi:hypothetical protein